MATGIVATYDGVGLLFRGDLAIIVYQAPARLLRSRWLFDRMDEWIERTPGGILALMLVLPTADPPDAPTRAENKVRLKKMGSRLKRLVTTPVGDALWFTIVRTVMRAMSILQGQSSVQFVCETVDEGVRRVLEAATPLTPPRSQVVGDIRAICAALGVTQLDVGAAQVEGRP
jgi:hypothetical protein